MNAETAFINEIIEKSDPFIRAKGGIGGYEAFREDYSKSLSKETDINSFAQSYIEAINKDEPESPFYSQVYGRVIGGMTTLHY